MERKKLRGGRLIEGAYSEADRTLEIVFSDLSVKQFKTVPHEVWKRLLAAPNAGTFYEDRIQEEYPGAAAPKLSAKQGDTAKDMGLSHANLFNTNLFNASLPNASSPHTSPSQINLPHTDDSKARLEALFGKKN